MAGFLDEALAFCPSRSALRRHKTVCIFPDDSSDPASSMNSPRSVKTIIRNTIPKSPAATRTKTPKAQGVGQRAPKILAVSTRRVPLQQSLKPPQAGASTVDIPGRGGGKENIPPGMSAHPNMKSKPIGLPPVYETTGRTERNTAPTKNTQLKPREMREKPQTRTAISEARGNRFSVPKPQPQNTLALNTQASTWPQLRASLQSNRDLQSSYIKTILMELVRRYWMLVGNVEDRRQLGRSTLICELLAGISFNTPPERGILSHC